MTANNIRRRSAKFICEGIAADSLAPTNASSFASTDAAKRYLLLLSLLILAFALPAFPAFGAPVAWVVPSMERVGPTAPPGSATSIDLFAAQGETESFQIIVRAPAGGLTEVNVIAPDLGGPKPILYREHYVYLSSGSSDWSSNRNHPGGPGWYPDALIPFVNPETGADLSGALDAVPFTLAADRNQPIWVDIQVPRTTPPGQYSGEFRVVSAQGATAVTLNLTVWNFALPEKPSAGSSFLLWSVRRDLASVKELLRHRIMASSVNPADERNLIDTLGMAASDVGFWSGADFTNCLMNAPPSVSTIQSAVANHQPDLHLYNYTADEIDPCPNLYEMMKSWARNLHAAGVDNLVTMAPVPELYDDGSGTGRSAVDIWVMIPKIYDWNRDRVIYCQQKGDEAWSYNCLMQDDYSPKWEIDFAPLNYRLQPGFINQSLGLTGILYWRADYWSSDPWNNVEGYAPYYPGEGMVVYPGAQVGLPGVVASMRLKYIRDGMDDYDYITLLKQRGEGDWALSIARTVGPDWSNWTRDPVAVETARKTLGDRLSGLGGSTHYISVTANATPSDLASGETTTLSAGATDSQGDPIITWRWSDGGAGGSFSPSATVQNPAYQAPINTNGTDMTIRLTVSAGCAETNGSYSFNLVVRGHEGPFYDISSSHWAYDEIMACSTAGIVNGYPDHLYRPSLSVTRSQMTVYLARALAGSDTAVPVPTTAPSFPDVSTNYWAYKYIEYAVAANIVTGYNDGLYHPDWTVTRAQMAVFIARAHVDPTGEAGLESYTPPTTPTFRDVPTSHWAYRHIEYIASRGVTGGFSDGYYRPINVCTRDQMAVYMARAFGLMPIE